LLARKQDNVDTLKKFSSLGLLIRVSFMKCLFFIRIDLLKIPE